LYRGNRAPYQPAFKPDDAAKVDFEAEFLP